MTLAEEAQLYLAVVEVFRREGCEPHWRAETWTRHVRSADSPEAVQATTKMGKK
jgi:hypothetical protein